MAIPDYQTLMLPLLRLTGDGNEHFLHDAIAALADEFELSDEERKELLPSGQQEVFRNRVSWALTYMKQAALLRKTRRGYFRITERGKEVLSQKPAKINAKFLEKFPEFIEFRHRKKDKEDKHGVEPAASTETPEEALEGAYEKLQEGLSAELLQNIKDCSPAFFERLVVALLVQMGYGGSRKEAGQAIGGTSDGGIDGIIKEDKLGLDIIFIQAKRWEGTVGRPEIQKFAGALAGQKAKKGIFITTSNFSNEALDYAKNIEIKIILIDGQRLAELMIDHNVGVSPLAAYEIKKIDTDYFIEE